MLFSLIRSSIRKVGGDMCQIWAQEVTISKSYDQKKFSFVFQRKDLCYVMLCYVMLCYVMLCYVMLCLNQFKVKIFTKLCVT